MKYYIEILKKCFDFKGRAERIDFWYFFLLNTIIGVILLFIMIMIIRNSNIDVFNGTAEFIFSALIVYLIMTILILAVSVRRLHDIGLSGWVFLIYFIPSIGQIVLLVLSLIDGDPGDNKYGPNPKISTNSTPPAQPTISG